MPNGREFKPSAIVPMRLAMPRLRHSLAALLAAGSLSALAFAPAASAAGDPVASGHFNLALSSGYKHQLRARKTFLSVRGLSIASGSLNPTDGTAALKLNGRLTFRHNRNAVTFDNLSATIGPNGALSGTAATRGRGHKRFSTALFRLSGGGVARDGFGARVQGVRASLDPRGKGNLFRVLGVRLPSGPAASLAVDTQPETVEVLGGMATVRQDLSPSGIAPKLRAHCIDPVDGVSPSGQATEPSAGNYLIPVAGGTISPTGWTAGVVDLAGGLDIAVGGPGLPAGCPTSTDAVVHFANFSVDIAQRSILTDMTVTGPGSPFGNSVIQVEMQGDTANAAMLADPVTHVLTALGAQLGLNQATAAMMNQLLPHPGGGPSTNFSAGDLLGSADMTVQAR